ncbi:kinase-like domain-containing protein [Dichotomocladium elegans]|nr:kinase-like domain-containing protein [Dichotomocladium elegans]
MDDNEIEPLYFQQIHNEFSRNTGDAIARIIEKCPHEFGLDKLIPVDPTCMTNFPEQLAQLYQGVSKYCNEASIMFDYEWHWALIWRRQLSYKLLAEKYGKERVVMSAHERARKAIAQIYRDKLDPYMQWFPWTWFSNMQFIGAGGFSAVYAAVMTQPYDLAPVQRALKVVDEKILNESKAFLPLLFQGLTVCETTGDLMMVMKLSNDGNLEDHMRRLPLGDLDMKTITGTILRLAANLADLHKAGMCHRNVHPRNIVCTDSDYFLVDYRFSTPSKESSSVTALTNAAYGQLPYIAPEVRQGIYTEKSDIYSLGIIIWQLVSKVIFPSPDMLLDRDRCHDDNVYRIDKIPGLPEWYERLYVACMEPLPENRPDAAEICASLQPIYDGIHCPTPLSPQVTEYIIARRAEAADHQRTYIKIKGAASTSSTTRLYTLSSLPSTSHLFSLPFTHLRFSAVWQSVSSTASSLPASPSLSEFFFTDIDIATPNYPSL